MTTFSFTDTCTFTRGDNGQVAIAWDNGNAVEAVRGAAIDYVDPKYHMAVRRTNGNVTYAPEADLARLIAGDINQVLALVIVGMRRVCASFEHVELNLAEVVVVADGEGTAEVTEANWNRVTGNAGAFKALLDIGPTILGMNGLSLMLKGHNYLENDSMWARLEAAADIESLVTPLGLLDYAGPLFHDALHPFTAEWKVRLAADIESPLIGHVNGVLMKRIPGVPAGTAIVFVTLAAIQEIRLIRPKATNALGGLADALSVLRDRIRDNPLNWCAAFQRHETAENLAKVSKTEPLCAFIYGACSVLFDRKVSILKSASFKNNAIRHTGMSTLGREWGEALEVTEMTTDAIEQMFQALVEEIQADNEDDGDETEGE